MIRFFPFESFHGKRDVGSTRLRVHKLIKYWPEAAVYKYAEKPDVMIYQKVYETADYIFPSHFKGIQILDICDPDWFDGAMIKNMTNLVDGITCATQPMADFIKQLTDKPVIILPDRHDLEEVPSPKSHKGSAKKVVWFGYQQNAEVLRFAVPTLERMGLQLSIISNSDPMAYRWANDPEAYQSKYKFKKYNSDTIYTDLQQYDICILPAGDRPQDRFKSNNKTIIAQLSGLPVATNVEELEQYVDGANRQTETGNKYQLAVRDYDVRLSVQEMKEFIDRLHVMRGTPPLSGGDHEK